EVDLLARPLRHPAARQRRVDHAPGTAHEVTTRHWCAEKRAKIKTARRIAAVEIKARAIAGKRRYVLAIGHRVGRACAVVKGEGLPGGNEHARRGENGGDPKAAGDEPMLARRSSEGKVVPRRARGEMVAGLDPLMHEGGTAASPGFAEHGDFIAIGLGERIKVTATSI